MGTVRKIAVLLVGGFGLGVVAGGAVDFGWSLIGLFFVLALAFASLFFIFERRRIFLILALIFFGIILGLIRYSIISDLTDDNYIFSQPSVSGLVTADPDRRDATTRLTVELVRSRIWLREKRLLTSPPVKILVVIDNFTDYKYGDKIELTGKIEPPQNFLTDKNKVFDYQNYLLTRGIVAVSYYPKIKILARGQGSAVLANLFALKNNFLNNLKQVLPEPSATLAGGLILGDKGGLGQRTENDFRQAGLSHIIVLSGYNISIVAEATLFVFSFVVGAWAWVLGIIALILFVLMTGGEAAAVRSAVMGATALVARRYGRTYDAGVALIFAGFLMILWNPRLLSFDLGFQLSFLATLGMIYLSPVVSLVIDKVSLLRRTTWLHEVALLKSSSVLKPAEVSPLVRPRSLLGGLKEIICTTTGAQLAVYPWLLYQTGNATLVGFISNIFVLPAVPLSMFLSFITGLTGFISSYLSLLASYPTYFFLDYILLAAHWFGNL